jgi:hypothetical protein
VKENIFKRGSQIFKFIVNGWGAKNPNKIFGCFGVRADERSGDKFGVFFRGVSGVELGDDHHTLPPLLFVALTPVLGPLLC